MRWAAAGTLLVAVLGCVAALILTVVERDQLRADLVEATGELHTSAADLAESKAGQRTTADERTACAALAGLYQKVILLLADEITANAADPRDPIDTTESASLASMAASLPCPVVSR